MSGSCDCVSFSCCTVTRPRARKEHRCGECRFPIARGEVHVRVTGICEGEASSHRFHVECDAFRHALEIHVKEMQAREELRPMSVYGSLCDCVAYGHLAEALNEFTTEVHGYRADGQPLRRWSAS